MTTRDLYQDKAFIQDSLIITASEINDLETISVYNGDVANEELYELREAFNKVKDKFLEAVK